MGFTEILIILALALILFGPEDLPDIARKLGKIAYKIRKTTSEMSREFNNAMNMPAETINKAWEQKPSPQSSEAKVNLEKEEAAEKEKEETVAETGSEELLTYEDEDQHDGAGAKPQESSPNPLSELPKDMVSYEERDVGR